MSHSRQFQASTPFFIKASCARPKSNRRRFVPYHPNSLMRTEIIQGMMTTRRGRDRNCAELEETDGGRGCGAVQIRPQNVATQMFRAESPEASAEVEANVESREGTEDGQTQTKLISDQRGREEEEERFCPSTVPTSSSQQQIVIVPPDSADHHNLLSSSSHYAEHFHPRHHLPSASSFTSPPPSHPNHHLFPPSSSSSLLLPISSSALPPSFSSLPRPPFRPRRSGASGSSIQQLLRFDPSQCFDIDELRSRMVAGQRKIEDLCSLNLNNVKLKHENGQLREKLVRCDERIIHLEATVLERNERLKDLLRENVFMRAKFKKVQNEFGVQAVKEVFNEGNSTAGGQKQKQQNGGGPSRDLGDL